MSGRERSEYTGIPRHYDDVYNAHEAKRDKLSRYRFSAMTAKAEEARLSHHNNVSRMQEKALADLQRRVERRHEARR
jgi:hypothetical protein